MWELRKQNGIGLPPCELPITLKWTGRQSMERIGAAEQTRSDGMPWADRDR